MKAWWGTTGSKRRILIIHSLLIITLSFTRTLSAEPILFLSTQLNPVEEADLMRTVILADFPGEVIFEPYDDRAVFNRLTDEAAEVSQKPSLYGGLHGDFVFLKRNGNLDSVDALLKRIRSRGFPEKFLKLGMLEAHNQYFIPWMQATYIMVANKKALKYLPENANLNALTYQELHKWAANMRAEAGKPLLGFPAGKSGLIHRFFQGYLYPSFTGGSVRSFKSSQAAGMWEYFRNLWVNVNPRSVTFSDMGEPLLSEDVWVAWDHTSRLINIFDERPEDFVAFPCPVGPRGRGLMVVLAGLGIPVDAVERQGAEDLIEFLTRPDTQLKTLKCCGFYPVVKVEEDDSLSPGLSEFQLAVSRQIDTRDALLTLLPVGLGDRANDFNSIYIGAFTKIVLRKKDPVPVLRAQAEKLLTILKETQAGCWPPDEPSTGPCPVD